MAAFFIPVDERRKLLSGCKIILVGKSFLGSLCFNDTRVIAVCICWERAPVDAGSHH